MHDLRRLAHLLVVLAATSPPASAQIPADRYLHYVPLEYPRIIRQTDASARLHLYGDRQHPAYRDAAPRDGIDDARAARLQALAVRFAPIMVRNSHQFPVDFRTFFERDSFPLHVDRWDIARATFAPMDRGQIDMARVAADPCPPGASDDDARDDCRLRALIERFGPERPPLEPEASAPAEREAFTILYLDLPGQDEATWKREYGTRMASDYGSARRVFAHPFIAEPAPGDGTGYEFVIQYWFFYPANDGPNNHEGDWEHINVVVTPLSSLTRTLDEAGVASLLSPAHPLEGTDPVVIKRIEYYLHHYVTRLDFSAPNAYAPAAEWRREVEALKRTDSYRARLWQRIRERAWRDDAESRINTRPIVWIGGDGIGVQNVLQMPGVIKDRDGHASYPYRGYYKRIGPGGVSERVVRAFDPREYFAGPNRAWPHVEDYGDAARIQLTPDWERVMEPLREDAGARRDWSWLVLPLRFGYPATPSPAAGFAAHSDMGNVSVVGPAYNNGWNRIGDSAGYDLYELKEASWTTPLGVRDSFFPRVGFLNAPILYFLIKPPFDLAWRTVALPVRAAVGSRQPTFLPANAPAERSVSVEVGPMLTDLPDDFVTLFFTREQFPEIIQRIAANLTPESLESLELVPRFGWKTAPAYSLVLHLSPRLSAESSLVVYDATVGFDFTSPALPQPIRTRGDVSQFEFQGATRFNLRTGAFQPYVKYGHGITWFRLDNVRVNGVPLARPRSPRFKPEARLFDFGFNETIIGGGIDWTRIRAGRAWLGVKASYTVIRHDLGFERFAAVEDFPALAAEVAGVKSSVWRQQGRVLFSIGF